MVLQVASHFLALRDHRDAVRLQLRRRSHARQHEQFGRIERARAQDHFARRAGMLRVAARVPVRDADGCAAIEQDALDLCTGFDAQVGAALGFA
ncbi:hypothetical protein D3C87_1956430 [compost metagenome]